MTVKMPALLDIKKPAQWRAIYSTVAAAQS